MQKLDTKLFKTLICSLENIVKAIEGTIEELKGASPDALMESLLAYAKATQIVSGMNNIQNNLKMMLYIGNTLASDEMTADDEDALKTWRPSLKDCPIFEDDDEDEDE